MMIDTLDLDARYTVDGYRGIAFHVLGYATTEEYQGDVVVCDDEDCDHRMSEMCWAQGSTDTVTDTETVRAVMVGDDREHLVSVDDLTRIEDEDYCGTCGQCGCTADGR